MDEFLYSLGAGREDDRPTRTGKRPKVEKRKERRAEAAMTIRTACSVMLDGFAGERESNGHGSAPACAFLRAVVPGVIQIVEANIKEQKVPHGCASDVDVLLSSIPRSNAYSVTVVDCYSRIAKIVAGLPMDEDEQHPIREWLARDGVEVDDEAPAGVDPVAALANTKVTLKYAIPFLRAMVDTGLADESLMFWTGEKGDTWPSDYRSFAGAIGVVYTSVLLGPLLRTPSQLPEVAAARKALSQRPFYEHSAADVIQAYEKLAAAFAAVDAAQQGDRVGLVPIAVVKKMCAAYRRMITRVESVSGEGWSDPFILFLQDTLPDILTITSARPGNGIRPGPAWPECATDVAAALERWRRKGSSDEEAAWIFVHTLKGIVHVWSDNDARDSARETTRAVITSFASEGPDVVRPRWMGQLELRSSRNLLARICTVAFGVRTFLEDLVETKCGDMPLAAWTGNRHDIGAHPGGAITSGAEHAYRAIIGLLPAYQALSFDQDQQTAVRVMETALPSDLGGSSIQMVLEAYKALYDGTIAIVHAMEHTRQALTDATRSGRAEQDWPGGILKLYVPDEGTHAQPSRWSALTSERAADRHAELVELPVREMDESEKLFSVIVVGDVESITDSEDMQNVAHFIARHAADTSAIVMRTATAWRLESMVRNALRDIVWGQEIRWTTSYIWVDDDDTGATARLAILVRDRAMHKAFEDRINNDDAPLITRTELYNRLLEASNDLRLQRNAEAMERMQMGAADTQKK